LGGKFFRKFVQPKLYLFSHGCTNWKRRKSMKIKDKERKQRLKLNKPLLMSILLMAAIVCSYTGFDGTRGTE
jgi:hypothetical protein